MKQIFFLFTIFMISILSFQLANAQPVFTDVTEASGINHTFRIFQGTYGGGVAVLDYNNDGFEDLFIAGGLDKDSFYHNNGDGTFSDITELAGLALNDLIITQGAVSADVNKDGHIDIFVTTMGLLHSDAEPFRAYNILYLNNGNGTFTDVSANYGFKHISTFSTGATFGDFNADGYPGLYVGNYFDKFDGNLGQLVGATTITSVDQLYINVQGEYCKNVTDLYRFTETGFGFGGVFTDYDNDNDLDLYVINDFGGPNQLYRNEFPDRTFTNVSEESRADYGINAMGTAVGDYNNDGLLDYFLTNIGIGIFMINRGSGLSFVDLTEPLGTAFQMIKPQNDDLVVPVSWGSNLFDYDNDTDVDLFICMGALNPEVVPNPNLLLENNGVNFKNVSDESGLSDNGIGRGSVTFDYDNDGDLDLFVVNQSPVTEAGLLTNTHSRLFRNDIPTGNWLKVQLAGSKSTTRGLGSRVEIVADGIKMIREIDGGSSHESQNSSIAHFGLADASSIDSLIIKWVGGNSQSLSNVQANQLITINEEEKEIDSPYASGRVSVFPSYFVDQIMIRYELPEFTSYTLEVIDVQAKRIELLVDNEAGFNGSYIWDVPSTLESGVYFFVINVGSQRYVTRGVKL